VTSVRQKIVAAARWGIENEPRIHYGEVRPMPLGRTLPLTTDCSGFVTICYFLAGAPDDQQSYCGIEAQQKMQPFKIEKSLSLFNR